MEREKLRFESYFAYLLERPSSIASFIESEQFAPDAFQKHIDVIGQGYQRVLRRAASAGDAHAVDPREYEVIAFMLMGARKYLSSRFARSNGTIRELPDFVTRAYMRFVCNGFWDEAAKIDERPAPPREKMMLAAVRPRRDKNV